MNLINDQWIRVKCYDGSEEIISPNQLTAFSGDKTIVDVMAPRADLKGTLYQFLIGLVQTTFEPEYEDDWEKYWFEPPEKEILRDAFESYKDVFNIDNDEYSFMQSYDDNELLNELPLPIEDIVGGTLSTATREKNRDHFVKRGEIIQMSPYWAAMSLFSMQIYGVPAWGQHRVGLRGNGPLTTLLLHTGGERESLWHKLWLNVLSVESASYLSGDRDKTQMSDIFPWMGKTRISPNKNPTSPENCHPHQHYWAMPRRIRLVFDDVSGVCDLTGEQHQKLATGYRRYKNGVYYYGGWMHPLTPYFVKADQMPNSVKIKSEGVVYGHWLGLTMGDQRDNKQCARVVSTYNKFRREVIDGDSFPILWVFGYHAKNAEVFCWYETVFPMFNVPNDKSEDVNDLVSLMVDSVVETINKINECVKDAWFKAKKKPSGDMSFLDTAFWSQTESRFYQLLKQALELDGEDAVIKKQWKDYIRSQALSLFDQWAMSDGNEDGDMKRCVKARTDLEKWLYTGKQIKKLAA